AVGRDQPGRHRTAGGVDPPGRRLPGGGGRLVGGGDAVARDGDRAVLEDPPLAVQGDDSPPLDHEVVGAHRSSPVTSGRTARARPSACPSRDSAPTCGRASTSPPGWPPGRTTPLPTAPSSCSAR